MSVPQIGLTVSHLPTSCSFFLSALQPLGYQFIGQWGNQIGLGVGEADFFLIQKTPGMKAGAAHIAFSATSRRMVRDFYAKALQAGGKPHGSPATRNDGEQCFNAAVLDMDGNSIEVVYLKDGDREDERAPKFPQSRVLNWSKDVSTRLGENKGADSVEITPSAADDSRVLVPTNTTVTKGRSHSMDDSYVSKSSAKNSNEAPRVQRTFSAPSTSFPGSKEFSKKVLIGTFLGAAAGATIAYAMCKKEKGSARAEEAAHSAFHKSSHQSQTAHSHKFDEPPPAYSSIPSPRSLRNTSEESKDRHPMRAIEGPPPSMPIPAPPKQIEQAPSSASGKRLNHDAVSLHHSSYSHSSRRSHHPRTPSSHSKRSSSRGENRRRSSSHNPIQTLALIPESGPVPASLRPSRRDHEADEPNEEDEGEEDEDDDAETVVPSDSISCAGESRHRKHRSRKYSSATSHHSHSSRRDDSRKHSEVQIEPEREYGSKDESMRKRAGKYGRDSSTGDGGSRHRRRSQDEQLEIVKPDEISEAGSERTVSPEKIERKYKIVGGVEHLPVRSSAEKLPWRDEYVRSVAA